MPTYHEAMTTDLSTLTSAADKWDDMAGEFKKLEADYKRDVHKISLGQSWRGVAATTANERFDGTLREYQAAQKEAKAIAALLRDAHAQFTELHSRLKSVRADAIADGMKVSEQGLVAYDYDKLSDSALAASRNDPDFAPSVRKAEDEWSQAIANAVKAINDADEGVKIALEAVIVDGNPMDGIGFNAKAKSDVEAYEVDKATDIATRINSGENVSAADRAELQRTLRDNSDNKDFTQTFLNRLGTDGTVRLANKLNDGAHSPDKKLKNQYQDLQKGLANTIANATQIPKSVAQLPPGSKAFNDWKNSNGADATFYRQFTENLEKTGTKNYGSNTDPLYGYQSLVGVMSHADTKFDDQFLFELGDDMIKAEGDRPGIFTQVGAGHDGIRSDALDGLLEVMSKNPDAATAFFDPDVKNEAGTGGGADHLRYLLGNGDEARDWPEILMATGTDADDPLSRTGLAAALETATTGRQPLKEGQDPWPDMPHSDAQARVMGGVVRELSTYEGSNGGVPENLRQPMARSLAQYTDDTHEILSGMNGKYIKAGGEGFFPEGTDSHMAVSQEKLVQAMRGLSEDPEAYGTLHKAESRYIDEEMARIPEGASAEERYAPLSKSGVALGTFTAIREDVINNERTAGYSEADWKSKIAYHVIGGVVTPMAIPTAGGSIVVGDALQRGVDTWAWTWGNEMKADADATANAEIADKYLSATNQMTLMTNEWAEGRTDIKPDTKRGQAQIETLIGAMHDGHDRGSKTAAKYM